MTQRFNGAIVLCLWAALALIPSGGCNRDGATPQKRVDKLRPLPRYRDLPRRQGVTYLELLVIGDQGTGKAGQRRVADGMAVYAKGTPIAAVLTLGDNIYPSGVTSVFDPQWRTKFEQIYTQGPLQVPFYASLGNHDYYSNNPTAQVRYTQLSHCACRCDAMQRCVCRPKPGRKPQKCWVMPERYYSFRLPIGGGKEVLLIALDTMAFTTRRYDLAPVATAQKRWLQQTLQRERAAWRILFGHHPIYSGGQHGPKKGLVRAIKPILERYPPDLYLAGHDHDLQLIEPRPFRGTRYVISGGAGKARHVTWTPDTRYAATNLGFVSLRFAANELLIRFLDADGRTRYVHRVTK